MRSAWDRGASNWLIVTNLTPQIDGSTLRTLCAQHGPLNNFTLHQQNGRALVKYSSKEEAAKVSEKLIHHLVFQV